MRLSCVALLTFVALGACRTENPAEHPPPARTAPVASAGSASVQEVTASEPPHAEPAAAEPVVPPERLPEIDPALAKRLGSAGLGRLEVAASVCAAAVSEREGKLRVGCRACPPFSKATGPDGHVERIDAAPEPEFYELEAVFYGGFSRAGAVEAAAVFNGCEPHSENWGGTLLVERRDRVWVATSYRSGFHPRHCQPFLRPDGRHMLVCSWTTEHQSFGHTRLDTYDFAVDDPRDPWAGWKNLVMLDDNSVSACWDDRPSSKLVVEQLVGFSLVAGQDSVPPQLRVDVRSFRGPRSAAHRRFCSGMLDPPERKPEKPGAPFAPALVPRKLDFYFDGSNFVPQKTTADFLKGREESDAAP